jgi:hypothetical protein
MGADIINSDDGLAIAVVPCHYTADIHGHVVPPFVFLLYDGISLQGEIIPQMLARQNLPQHLP